MKVRDDCRFGNESERQVATCSPELQRVLRKAIRVAPRWLDFAVICGYRNQADQDEAFAKGMSKKRYPYGPHNQRPSKAADVRPASPFTAADWNDLVRFGRIMGFIESVALEEGVPVRLGLDWDRDGRSIDEKFRDLGHIEECETTA